MNKDDLNIFSLISKPLLFASKNNFTNLDKVKNLKQSIDELILKVKSQKLDTNTEQLLDQISSIFRNFEKSTLSDKKVIINNTLELISKVKSDLSSDITLESDPNHLEIKTNINYNNLLGKEIRFIKGVGPRISSLFSKVGVNSIEDLLFYFPRNYEDRRKIQKISTLLPGKKQTTIGKIVLSGKVRTKSRSFFKISIDDGSANLNLIWFRFNEKYLRNTYKKGINIIVNGEITYSDYERKLQIIHPKPENIEVVDEDDFNDINSIHFNRIVPIYPLTEGLKQRRVRSILYNTITNFGDIFSKFFPDYLLNNNFLLPLSNALKLVHFPDDKTGCVDLSDSRSVYLSLPHKTVAFYEFFLLELGLGLKKRDHSLKKGILFNSDGKLVGELIKSLPFKLTQAQKRVIDEIISDMSSSKSMNRLLQGDVGSGKTIVSLISMLKAVESGYQAVLMVPTEILSEQHMRTIENLLSNLNVNVVLLKSALTKKEKDNVNTQISNGEAHIIIGTHALIEQGVSFNRLGLVVIDEQHRFGVMQRAKLMQKGINPDVLVMTATPIPRTLAITVYGDLDVSIIDKLPSGRKKIITYSYKDNARNRKQIYSTIQKELENGRQGYFVYPFIDESENNEFKHIRYATKMYQVLSEEIFANYKVGLLHGRMKSDEKDKVMDMFVNGKINLLVSTTVVEVGVDVPNASFMIIENAERYGLSQLHQLRGRIGRGEHKSICMLVSSYGASDEANAKLNIMCNTTDGFKVSEADLSIRGPGEFLGTRQSGVPQFRFANLVRDWKILSEARDEAFALLDKDPMLANHPDLKDDVESKWGEMLDLQSFS